MKIDFNTDLVGINTNAIGNTKLTGSNTGVGTGTTVTLVEFPKSDFNALYANIYVEDTITKNINYNEIDKRR